MSIRTPPPIQSIALVLFLSFLVPLRASAQASPRFWATIYAANPDYLEVTLETKNLQPNTHLSNVSLTATVFDAQGARLGNVNLRFASEKTQGDIPRAKEPVKSYFAHGYANAGTVRNGVLHWELWTDGAKTDDPSAASEPRKLQGGDTAVDTTPPSAKARALGPVPKRTRNTQRGAAKAVAPPPTPNANP